jgi:hypothetical protein
MEERTGELRPMSTEVDELASANVLASTKLAGRYQGDPETYGMCKECMYRVTQRRLTSLSPTSKSDCHNREFCGLSLVKLYTRCAPPLVHPVYVLL